MALSFATLVKPANSQVVDPSTGVMSLEWQLYFADLTTRLNGAVDELTDPAPVPPIDAEYVVATANGTLSAERVVTDTATVAKDVGTAGQLKLNVPDDAITFAKLQNIATDRLIGRDTAASGNAEEIALDDTLEFTGSGSIQRAALTGDVTSAAGSNTTAIASDAVTNAKLANMAQATIKGRQAGGGTGDPEDLTAAQARTAIGAANIAGDTFTGNVSIAPAGNAGLELGRVDGIASTPFFDFHSGATAVDYDARMLASGGSGVTGGGTLNILAANLQWNGNPLGMVRLTSGTVAAAATLDLVLTAYTAYRGLIFELSGFLPVTNGADLFARFSTNGGSTYDSAAGNYIWAARREGDAGAGANAGSTSATEIRAIGVNDVGNASNRGINITYKLMNQPSGAFSSRLSWQGAYINNAVTGAVNEAHGAGLRVAAQDTDAVRFLFSSGNIAAGNYAVFGIL